MAAKNDITGDALVTKTATEAYRDGWDRIFGKKPLPPCDPTATQCPRCNNPNGPKLGPCELDVKP